MWGFKCKTQKVLERARGKIYMGGSVRGVDLLKRVVHGCELIDSERAWGLEMGAQDVRGQNWKNEDL